VLPTIVEKYGLVPGRGVCAFDPGTLTVMSLAATAAGAATSAAGTIAGGRAAQLSGQAANASANYTAQQLESNAAAATAAGQRRMLDTQDKSRLLQSTAIARAAGSGTNPGVGSPLATVGDIAQRGSYKAAMDLWSGQNTATGLINQAAGARYSGNAALIGGNLAMTGADYGAAGTIAGAAGSMVSSYGRYAYPQMYGGMR
jgi:hypothetical protein